MVWIWHYRLASLFGIIIHHHSIEGVFRMLSGITSTVTHIVGFAAGLLVATFLVGVAVGAWAAYRTTE